MSNSEFKVRPFYIEHTPDVTDKNVADVFDKAVAAGAILYDGVKNIHDGKMSTPSNWRLFGVDSDNKTRMWDSEEMFGDAVPRIKLDQVDEWLGIKKESTVAERMAALIEQNKDTIPDWAAFIAYTATGNFVAFYKRPDVGLKSWLCGGRYEVLNWNFGLDADWRETLTEMATIKQSLTVDQNEKISEQDEMIMFDDRLLSDAEFNHLFDDALKEQARRHRAAKKELTFPSTCPTEQAIPMMLGGDFGGVKC